MNNKKNYILMDVVIIILLGFTVYINSLNGKFVWDDYGLIRDNVHIRSWANIPGVFANDMKLDTKIRFTYYRPFQILTYIMDYSVWSFSEIGYHLTNMLLHIGAALAVFWLITILFKNRFLSLLTALFFVTHPVQTEAVAYISGRADPLATLLMLLCFIFYIKSQQLENKKTYVLVLLTFTLALLSRENSLILPVLLLLYHYTFEKRIMISRLLPVFCIAFLYILRRMTILDYSIYPKSSATTLFQRIPGFFTAIANYFKLMLLPLDLHMEYGNKLFSLTSPGAILGFVILISLLVYAFKVRNSNRLIFFSISWFLITLLPASNLYPIKAYMAEHWLYLPSIGFFLLLAQYLHSVYNIKSLRIVTIAFIAGLLALYSLLTVRQTSYWKEPINFYKKTLRYTPDSARAYNNLGVEYKTIGKTEEAISSFKKAIELNPNFLDACYNLACTYHNLGRYKEAIYFYKKTIELDPDHAMAYYNLGSVCGATGDMSGAAAYYEKAKKINPALLETCYNLGIAYKTLGKNNEAIPMFKKAIEFNPDNVNAYRNLADLYSDTGNYPDAIISYNRLIELNPNDVDIYNNLGTAYIAVGKTDDAIKSYEKAKEISPNIAEIYFNLGIAYNSKGEIEKAVSSYQKTLELNPKYIDAYYNLGAIFSNAGRYNEAINLYKKALELNPDYAPVHNNLAVAYYNSRQYELAIPHCDKAVELGYKVNPDFLEALKPFRGQKSE